MMKLLNKQTILIVDDIPRNIQLAAEHLKVHHYRLLFATSGEMAISILHQNRVDLILLDIMMPHVNGYETCRRIKSVSQWSDIPIIFLTSRDDISDIVKGFESGGADYITKPFYGQELVARVKTQLELKDQRSKLERNQHQLKDLLHILSHDLRNSLSGIAMTIDLADLEEKPVEIYKDRLKDLSSNGLKILDLVRTMMVLEEKPLQLNSVNLNDCIRHTVHLLNTRFEEKGIKVVMNLGPDIEVLAEETSLINSVLMNVLTNALKFSYEGETVSVSITKEGSYVSLKVKDKGVGISEDKILHLFDVQKGISLVGTRGEKGSGFGLPLVEKFMNAYGGEVQVESHVKGSEQKDTGTTFTLLFHCSS